MTSVLTRLQRGLEALYRVETGLDVAAFVVDEAERDRAVGGGARRPREQLLVAQSGPDDLSLALFLDRAAIANLQRHDPAEGLHEANFWDFCLAVEGVSHFIYVALCAAADRAVTALELELQAEVDKFVTCTLMGAGSAEMINRLYEAVRLDHALDDDERERYRTANDQARRYAGSLDRRYLGAGRTGDMLAELRRFYRLPLQEKMWHIADAAA